MDSVYALPFTKALHPSYKETIPAYEQIRASITTHRGCFGGCAFCAITHHQGKTIQSRSEASILQEITKLSALRWFKGSISDIGGPTANMYGLRCGNPSTEPPADVKAVSIQFPAEICICRTSGQLPCWPKSESLKE